MKTALVIGATGMIGKLLTIKLLDSNHYTKVKVLVRKNINLDHPKLEQIIIDFDKIDVSKIMADDVFCCLGTTMRQAGSKEAFYKVDFTFPHEIAQIALKNGTTQYAIITAMGSDPKSSIYYNRVKGEVEQALADLNFHSLLIFRPSMLVGERAESRLGEKIGQIFMNLFDFFIPKKYKVIHGDKVAEAMLQLSQKNLHGKQIYESNILQDF